MKCKHSQIHSFRWLTKGKTEYRYSGDFKNGRKDGVGKFIFDNGDVYDGDVRNDEFQGNGKPFRNNRIGTMEWADGNTYTGDFKMGLMQGRGKYTFRTGKIYAGNFKDGECSKFISRYV